MLIIVCSTRVSITLYYKSMKTDLLIRFGNKVKARREELDLSQEELARLANVHRTYVGMIERAEKNITLTNISKLANALNVEIKDLF